MRRCFESGYPTWPSSLWGSDTEQYLVHSSRLCQEPRRFSRYLPSLLLVRQELVFPKVVSHGRGA